MTLLIKIALVFFLGLIGGSVFKGNLCVFSILALLFGFFAFTVERGKEGFLLLSACLCGASASVSSARQVVPAVREAASLDPGERGAVSGVVERVERRREGGAKILLKGVWLRKPDSKKWNRVSKRIQLYTETQRKATRTGSRVVAMGKIHPFRASMDWERISLHRGVVARIWCSGEAGVAEFRRPRRLWDGLSATRDALRRRVEDLILSLPPHRGRALLWGVLLGPSSSLPRDMRERFASLGIAHLLAISGLHMAILGGFFFLLFFSVFRCVPFVVERLSVQRLAAGLTVPLLGVYWAITGLRPSTTRALVMLCAFFGAPVFFRPSSVKSAVSVAFISLAAWRPFWVGTPGFQLSFLAVVCLCFCGEIWNSGEEERLKMGASPSLGERVKRGFWGLLGVSLMAGAATWGLVAFHFGRVAPVGVLVNLVVVPVVCWVLLPLAFAGVVLGVVAASPGIALLSLAAGLAEGLLEGLGWIVPAASLLPSRLRFNLLQVLVYYFSGAAFVSWRHPATRWKRGRWLAAVGASVLVGSFVFSPRERLRYPRITFLSLGRGEAILIQLPSEHSILVDTGERGRPGGVDLCRKVLLPLLSRRGVQKLDLLVITHPHSDHIGNSGCVLEELSVRELWWNGDRDPEGHAAALLKKCSETQTRVVDPVSRVFGESRLRVVHPHPSSLSRGAGPDPRLEANNNSLVLLLSHPNGRVLLTGDIGREIENNILDKQITADVLKVPHHGSWSSSCPEFIQAVSPVVAVACGRGPPPRFDEVKGRYKRLKVPLLTTWRWGRITVEIREGGVHIKRAGSRGPLFYDHLTTIGPVSKNRVRRLGF